MDILSLLMLQNGTEMTAANSLATFDKPLRRNAEYFPGEEALRFYTDFSNPAKEVYTWNASMPDAEESFIEGKVGFFIGYSYEIERIRNRAPQLNFGIVSIPQVALDNTINYGNYWVEVVSKKSEYPAEAWDFILFIANNERVKKYLEITKKPPALKKLVEQYKNDPELGPFALQSLTAKSWYKGKDSTVVENVFSEMIDAVVDGRSTIKEAIKAAVGQVNQTY